MTILPKTFVKEINNGIPQGRIILLYTSFITFFSLVLFIPEVSAILLKEKVFDSQYVYTVIPLTLLKLFFSYFLYSKKNRYGFLDCFSVIDFSLMVCFFPIRIILQVLLSVVEQFGYVNFEYIDLSIMFIFRIIEVVVFLYFMSLLKFKIDEEINS